MRHRPPYAAVAVAAVSLAAAFAAVPHVRAEPACVGYAGRALRACERFCVRHDCVAAPRPLCERLRRTWQRRTGATTLPCEPPPRAADLPPAAPPPAVVRVPDPLPDPGPVPSTCGDGRCDGPVEECDPPGSACGDVGTCGDDCRCTRCGNGRAEPGEDCDGDDLRGETCASQGLADGVLRCTPSCTLDTSECCEPHDVSGSWSGAFVGPIGGTWRAGFVQEGPAVVGQGTFTPAPIGPVPVVVVGRVVCTRVVANLFDANGTEVGGISGLLADDCGRLCMDGSWAVFGFSGFFSGCRF